MKQIPLKTVDVTLDGKQTRISYREQLREIMRTPSDPKGVDLEELRKSLRVLEAIHQAQDVLMLEDADYEYMRRRVLATRWQLIDPFILTFVEDVTHA